MRERERKGREVLESSRLAAKVCHRRSETRLSLSFSRWEATHTHTYVVPHGSTELMHGYGGRARARILA